MRQQVDRPSQEWLLAERYRVDGSIGRGGMSEVFHGYDQRLDRRVAIKLLHPSPRVPTAPDSPESADILDTLERNRKRFLREIRMTAQLELPGIPAVYDTGTEPTPGGTTQTWLVMQLLRGTTLETVLDYTDYVASPPTLAWATAIATQIAAVLADVHKLDIVHRDIKPANVMLSDGGLVKVLDFGIAILRGAAALPRLTQIDRTVGTPPYMSPEQCIGQAVTTASDVYSLGCLLCELLTGDLPFHENANTSLRAHHLQTPPPSVRARRADIPEEVDALVIAMLAKDPRLRPTAEQVYEALLPLASDEPPSSADDGRDPTRPFRRPLLNSAPHRADTSGRGRLSDNEFAALKAEIGQLLDRDRPAEAIRLLEEGLERAGHDHALELQLRHFLGVTLFYTEEYTRAAALLDVAGRDYVRYLPPTDRYVLDCAYHAGHAYAACGKPDKALPQLRFYVQNSDPAIDPDEASKIVESRFAIAQIYSATGDLEDALTEFKAVRGLVAQAFGPQSTHVQNIDKQIERLRKC